MANRKVGAMILVGSMVLGIPFLAAAVMLPLAYRGDPERAAKARAAAHALTERAAVNIRANEREAIAAVLQRDPAYRALHDKAAAYYELARQQKAG